MRRKKNKKISRAGETGQMVYDKWLTTEGKIQIKEHRKVLHLAGY